jgi:hypothetical protein
VSTPDKSSGSERQIGLWRGGWKTKAMKLCTRAAGPRQAWARAVRSFSTVVCVCVCALSVATILYHMEWDT